MSIPDKLAVLDIYIAAGQKQAFLWSEDETPNSPVREAILKRLRETKTIFRLTKGGFVIQGKT